MANLMDAGQLERYTAQLEEDQADRDLWSAWQDIQAGSPHDVDAEYRYTSLAGYLNATLSVTAFLPRGTTA